MSTEETLPVPADPVFDGELVGDDVPVSRRRTQHRFMNWWMRSRRVPAALKSRKAAEQAGRDAVVWLLRSPFRFASSVGRGAVVAGR